ncbi:MAG TPA: type IV pilus twitching motility protein PilT [bacterium]|nr:type IV pilus twitching motility protein PilT [bacterium]
MSDAPQVSLQDLLTLMIEQNASDLHITSGSPPQLRIDGSLRPVNVPPLSPTETKRLAYSVLTEKQKKQFEEKNELDLSFGVKNLSRFRANVFMQRGAISAAIRVIPYKILDFKQLGLPPVVEELAKKPKGLILVTGPTGSGKSTTLASIVDYINRNRKGHIVTIEDPIEFIHSHKNCIINQREVGADTGSFGAALRVVLRQDPDVVLIGEIRDLETMSTALSVSETGHLALATLHTNSTIETINRIIDMFPVNQQSQVRAQLSFVLVGIVAQTLVPKKYGGGRVIACEIMVPNPAIRNLIREEKLQQIYSSMQSGQKESSMQTMTQDIARLVKNDIIDMNEALAIVPFVDEFQNLLAKSNQPTRR